MKLKTLRSTLTGICALMFAATLAAQPTTTKSTTKTGATTETRVMEGTVMAVDGNHLVVRMANGDLRFITATSSQRALIDGKEVAAKDLQVGTKLKATVTTTTTSLVDRTATVGTGRVWYVAPPNVILTLPNGENRQYKATSDYKFMVEGKPATVFELRKGMRVSAEKIVEEPRTVISANSVVTGELPPAAQTASAPVTKATPEPARTPEPVRTPEPARTPETTPSPSAAPKSTAPAAEPAPTPAAEPAPAAAAPPVEPVPVPAQQPQTGSTTVWIVIALVVLVVCYLAFRSRKRQVH